MKQKFWFSGAIGDVIYIHNRRREWKIVRLICRNGNTVERQLPRMRKTKRSLLVFVTHRNLQHARAHQNTKKQTH